MYKNRKKIIINNTRPLTPSTTPPGISIVIITIITIRFLTSQQTKRRRQKTINNLKNTKGRRKMILIARKLIFAQCFDILTGKYAKF